MEFSSSLNPRDAHSLKAPKIVVSSIFISPRMCPCSRGKLAVDQVIATCLLKSRGSSLHFQTYLAEMFVGFLVAERFNNIF